MLSLLFPRMESKAKLTVHRVEYQAIHFPHWHTRYISHSENWTWSHFPCNSTVSESSSFQLGRLVDDRSLLIGNLDCMYICPSMHPSSLCRWRHPFIPGYLCGACSPSPGTRHSIRIPFNPGTFPSKSNSLPSYNIINVQYLKRIMFFHPLTTLAVLLVVVNARPAPQDTSDLELSISSGNDTST